MPRRPAPIGGERRRELARLGARLLRGRLQREGGGLRLRLRVERQRAERPALALTRRVGDGELLLEELIDDMHAQVAELLGLGARGSSCGSVGF